MKKNIDSKYLLFEMMNKVGGMPLYENDEPNTIITNSGKKIPIRTSEEDIEKGLEMLDRHNQQAKDSGRYFIIGVTGKYRVYFTLWRYIAVEAQVNPLVFLQNASQDFLTTIEKAIRLSQRGGNFPIILEEDTTLKSMRGEPEDTIMFGKYRGRKLGEIFVEDPKYVVWIAKEMQAKNKRDSEFLAIAKGLADGYFTELTNTNQANDNKNYRNEDVGTKISDRFVITFVKNFYSFDVAKLQIRGENDGYRYIFYCDANKLDKYGDLSNKTIEFTGKIKEKKEIVGKKYTVLNFVKIVNVE